MTPKYNAQKISCQESEIIFESVILLSYSVYFVYDTFLYLNMEMNIIFKIFCNLIILFLRIFVKWLMLVTLFYQNLLFINFNGKNHYIKMACFTHELYCKDGRERRYKSTCLVKFKNIGDGNKSKRNKQCGNMSVYWLKNSKFLSSIH
jgi:hypothetical protein